MSEKTKAKKQKEKVKAVVVSKHKRVGPPMKNRKSPRGAKGAKVLNHLIDEVDYSFKRCRNDYNAHMAKVAKLARML